MADTGSATDVSGSATGVAVSGATGMDGSSAGLVEIGSEFSPTSAVAPEPVSIVDAFELGSVEGVVEPVDGDAVVALSVDVVESDADALSGVLLLADSEDFGPDAPDEPLVDDE